MTWRWKNWTSVPRKLNAGAEAAALLEVIGETLVGDAEAGLGEEGERRVGRFLWALVRSRLRRALWRVGGFGGGERGHGERLGDDGREGDPPRGFGGEGRDGLEEGVAGHGLPDNGKRVASVTRVTFWVAVWRVALSSGE
jgi:hypothetical protein